MSYPRDLDEYTDKELTAELSRRERNRQAGICDYCGQSRAAEPCRFPERHALANATHKPELLT